MTVMAACGMELITRLEISKPGSVETRLEHMVSAPCTFLVAQSQTFTTWPFTLLSPKSNSKGLPVSVMTNRPSSNNCRINQKAYTVTTA